jgi:hypothetical protein
MDGSQSLASDPRCAPSPPAGRSRRRLSIAMRPLLRVVLLAHFLAGSLVGAGAAQVRPVRLATRPEVFQFPQTLYQSAALLPDGRFAAVWTQGRTTFLQYVDSHGTVAFGAPGRAVAASSLLGEEPVVVAHARDGVLVAVRRHIDDRYNNTRILVQWLDGHGNPRWGAGAYAAPVAGTEEQRDPFLLASPDGGGFVCFVRAAQHVARDSFYCQRFSPEGQRLWGTEGAMGRRLSPLYAEEPKAVAAGDGGLLVFWRDWAAWDEEDEKTFLRGQRLGPDGSRRWGDDGTIIFKTTFPCANGCILTPPWISAVSDGAGGAILAFDDRAGRLPARGCGARAYRWCRAGRLIPFTICGLIRMGAPSSRSWLSRLSTSRVGTMWSCSGWPRMAAHSGLRRGCRSSIWPRHPARCGKVRSSAPSTTACCGSSGSIPPSDILPAPRFVSPLSMPPAIASPRATESPWCVALSRRLTR